MNEPPKKLIKPRIFIDKEYRRAYCDGYADALSDLAAVIHGYTHVKGVTLETLKFWRDFLAYMTGKAPKT